MKGVTGSMSNYTTTIDILEKSGFKFGLEDYPIFNEEYRETLNEKIINHFRYREIGQETPALFNHYLRITMIEIMPYYNQRYESQLIEFDPLNNVKMKETFKRLSDGTSRSQDERTGSNTANNRTIFEDTPNGAIDKIETPYGGYATSINFEDIKSSDTNKGVSSSTGEQREEYERLTEGSSAGLPFSKAIDQLRETFINVDMEVIAELEDLFMLVY